MISGLVNTRGEARIALTIFGAAGRAEQVEAIIDTGFSGHLTLPSEIITRLSLSWLGREEGILGDGSKALFEVFEGTVSWHSTPLLVEINRAETVPLVGMELLRGSSVRIDIVAGGKVLISPLNS